MKATQTARAKHNLVTGCNRTHIIIVYCTKTYIHIPQIYTHTKHTNIHNNITYITYTYTQTYTHIHNTRNIYTLQQHINNTTH